MLEELAEYITNQLKAHNIIVLRNESDNGSIYLTFDCGQSGFLRISDHKARSNTNARYNLVTTQKTLSRVVVPTNNKTYNIIKYYYPISEIDLLIQDILNYVEVRKQYIGEKRYIEFCKYAIRNKVGKCDGFWDTCKIV